MKRMKKFFADNGLLLIFVFLFLAFLIGQILCGSAAYNATRGAHGLPPTGYWQYMATGDFLEGMFSNWQAAIFQLGSLVIFGIFLRARGAAHSIDPGKPGKGWAAHRHPAKAFSRLSKKSSWNQDAPTGLVTSWLYCNSLSIAFVALFAVCFVLHVLSGAASYNEQLALSHRAPLTLAAYFVSSNFWFTTFQTWEAEYMAIAVYIFFTIFLRQEGSPESKPVGASNTDTGETNK
jgi:hypothetical protein